MISNQILQNTIEGLKNITRADLCVIDVEGKILAATFPNADEFVTPARSFVSSPADSQVVNGCQFFKVFDDHQLEYILLANGEIVEQGNHQELLKQKGRYYDLYMLQFSKQRLTS